MVRRNSFYRMLNHGMRRSNYGLLSGLMVGLATGSMNDSYHQNRNYNRVNTQMQSVYGLNSSMGTNYPQIQSKVAQDVSDNRDYIYTPQLGFEKIPEVFVNPHLDLIPVRDQGNEASSSGHAVVAAAEIIFVQKTGKNIGISPDIKYELSERWAEEFAKKYDTIPGEDYEGVPLRAAMKAWRKHGICLETDWIYESNNRGYPKNPKNANENATHLRIAHFERVWPHPIQNIRYIMDALVRFGVVVASINVHAGWSHVSEGIIPFDQNWPKKGLHAVAIVGYSKLGFLIRNSLGTSWGNGGYAWVTYLDAQKNLQDVWVATKLAPNSFTPWLESKPFQSNKIQQNKQLLEKFQKIMSISKEIEISWVAQSLGLTQKMLLEKLIEWQGTIPFKIKGDLIVVENINDFIGALDDQFDNWEDNEENKEGKKE